MQLGKKEGKEGESDVGQSVNRVQGTVCGCVCVSGWHSDAVDDIRGKSRKQITTHTKEAFCVIYM